MPSSDPDRPVVLCTETTEVSAALLVARLASQGIHAETCGSLISSFRADCPGGVQVLVRPEDVARARDLLVTRPTAQP